MNFEDIYDKVRNLDGWMGKQDCLALHEATGDLKRALIVEIGSYGGISTTVMALSSPTSEVIAIDPYLKFPMMYGRFVKATEGLNIKLIRSKSQVVGKNWDKPIDFLHIDGDHSYEMVKKDIELFVPHLKKNHLVYFHDYPVTDFGVARAVDKLKDEYFSELIIVSGFACGKKK